MVARDMNAKMQPVSSRKVVRSGSSCCAECDCEDHSNDFPPRHNDETSGGFEECKGDTNRTAPIAVH